MYDPTHLVDAHLEDAISLQQIKNNLHFQPTKLYDKLNIELSVNHTQHVCCNKRLADEEMFVLQKAFSLRCSFSETEESAVYFVSGVWLYYFVIS